MTSAVQETNIPTVKKVVGRRGNLSSQGKVGNNIFQARWKR